MKQKIGKGIAIVLLMVVATSCTISENKHYRVHAEVNGVHMTINKSFSHVISDVLWLKVCNALPVCTGNWLHDNVKVSGWGAAEWHGGTRQYADLASAIGTVYSHRNDCLSLHKNWVANLNWYSGGC
jgi:hypothetical protein